MNFKNKFPSNVPNLRRRYSAFFGGTLLATLLTVISLSGCSPSAGPKQSFNATDITGAPFARDFALTDHTGKARTLADFKGKVVLISFGYTQCPDFCPATLANWRAVMEQLGDASKDVQALFVTVDPERDTQELLSKYVPAFNPTFLGLRGTTEQTKSTAAEYKVIYQKSAGATPETYTVDHSTSTFVHGRDGRVRLMIAHGTESAKIAADLKVLLAEK